jgi:hypothetical protein
MRLGWCIATLFLAVSIIAVAQDRAFIRLGPAFAYRSTSATLTSELAGRTVTSTPSSILADALGIALGASFPIADRFHVRADIESFTSSGTASDILPITVVVNGQSTSGSIRRDHDLRSTWYAAATGLSFHATPRVNVDAILGVQAVTSFTATWTETIENPSGATWVSTGTPTRTLTPVTSAGTPTRLSAYIGLDLGTSITLYEPWYLQPSVRVRYAVTPALNGSDWRPLDIGFSLAVAWQSAPSQRLQFTRRTEQRDTVTMVDAFDQTRRDTVWRERSSEVIDTIRYAEVDSVLIEQRTIIERHVPAPPPFLSTIIEATVTSHDVDSLISVDLDVSVESDTTTTTELRAVVDDKGVWSNRFTAKGHRQTVPLGRLVNDLARRTEVMVTFEAITTDAYGQRRAAVPVSFTLRRASQHEPLHKN